LEGWRYVEHKHDERPLLTKEERYEYRLTMELSDANRGISFIN